MIGRGAARTRNEKGSNDQKGVPVNASLVQVQRQYVAKKALFSFLGNTFRIFDTTGGLQFYIKQKAFKLKEEINVFADEQQAEKRLTIKARGIGAGMAVRREPIVSLGGFDENMGPGAEFPSAGDRDLAIRALLKGWWVYETVSTSVIHFGYRTWAEGRELTRRDWLAMGAMCAKPIKCGYWQTAIFALYESIGYGILQPLAPLFKGKRPQGFRRFVFFWRGFLQGWQTPVAHDTLVFLGPVPVALPLAARELEQRPQA